MKREAMGALAVAVLAVAAATTSANAGTSAHASATCAPPSEVRGAYGLRTNHASCRLARKVVRSWNRHSGACATGTDPGGPRHNTCRIRAGGHRFKCSTRYAYAQVSKTRCVSGRRVVKFRYDPTR